MPAKTPLGDACSTPQVERSAQDSHSRHYLQGVLEATDKVDRTPIHYAALSDMPRLIDLAAQKFGKAIASHLMRTDKRGQTPLHLAAFRGSLSVFQTLLELMSPAGIQHKDAKGRSVVHILLLALFRSDAGAVVDCIQLLRTLPDAPLAVPDAAGRTPEAYLTRLCVNSPALLARLQPLLAPVRHAAP